MQTPIRRRTIAINGAGIAGAALAYWLARFGFTPILYERAPARRMGGYLIDFWGKGYDLAEQMGLMPVLQEKGYVVEHMRMLDAEGRQRAHLDARLMSKATGGRYLSIARSDLAGALLDALPGLTPDYGRWVKGFVQDTDGVTLQLSDGSTTRADLLIGADGLHSTTRATLFPGQNLMRPLGYHVAAAQVQGYGPRDALSYMSHTIPGHQVARFSMRDDTTLLFFVLRTDEPAPPYGDEAIRAYLKSNFGAMGWEAPQALAALDDVREIYCDTVAQIRAPHWADGRVALLGDAAGCASLLAGEGSGLAMISAYCLAVELAQHPDDHATAFTAWQTRLRPFVLAKQDAALGFGNFFAPDSARRLWMRDMAVKALGAVPFAHLLLRRQFRDKIDLPALPMGN